MTKHQRLFVPYRKRGKDHPAPKIDLPPLRAETAPSHRPRYKRTEIQDMTLEEIGDFLDNVDLN